MAIKITNLKWNDGKKVTRNDLREIGTIIKHAIDAQGMNSKVSIDIIKGD